MVNNTGGKRGFVRGIVDNVYLLWLVLTLPAIYILAQFFVLHGRVPYVPLTGEISGWLLIVTMMITPLMLLVGPLPWLKARRRYLGVASFGYACLHLFFWLTGANMGVLIRSFERFDILVGWIAMGLFVLLALTSNDYSVRAMGTKWKSLQRWVYPAAILTFVHWVMTTDKIAWAVIYCLPLIALSVWRVLRARTRMSRV
ncbi:MAG: ferric reductase-like transmembrane domain-containing protein [Paracoccaceae bacterium]